MRVSEFLRAESLVQSEPSNSNYLLMLTSLNLPISCFSLQLRQQGMSQAQAAAVVGVDDTTISKWESKQFSDLKFQDAKTPDLRISVPKDRYLGSL